MEILEFIFQDFWHWLGTAGLLAIVVSPLIKINFNINSNRSRPLL